MQQTGRLARRTILASAGGCLAPAAGARAAVDPRLRALGWEELSFEDKPANTYTLEPDGSIRIESNRSVSVIWLDLPSDPTITPILHWRWRIDRAVPPTDLRRKGGDDRSLAVYVAFAYVPERASLVERSMRAILTSIAGRALPGRMLSYVWGGDGPSSSWFDNPYLPIGGRIRVLRGIETPTGAWLEERVDIDADFREAFGEEPTKVVQIGVSADSDDTRTTASARICGFAWLPRG